VIALVLLLASSCSLAGHWEGEVDCGSYDMPVSVDLEADGGEYTGEGELDCSNAWGGDCRQQFDLTVEPEGGFGEDCRVDFGDGYEEGGCTDPDDVEWDGEDTITGEWNGCDIEIERGD
jgi:hypothetical protein